MPNFRLFTGNRLENLADKLAEVTGTPLSSPFEAEVIVVQSRGMERWISMELALRHGICANIDFPFPNAFVNDVLQKALPNPSTPSLFKPEVMTWKIMELLPSLINRQGFESLRVYLEDREDGLRLFQLSERIADLFDQYLLFRPEMILKWDHGEGEHWQAVLWRELVKGFEMQHRAALGMAFIGLMKDPSTQLEDLPERISVFGISTLPPFHMHVFASISRFTPVNLFFMNPCMEYWGDIASDWEIKRAAGGQFNLFETEDLHLEKGNSLLVSTGMLGREFFDLINEFNCEEIQVFGSPGEDTLLHCIQSDILNLRERGNGSVGKKADCDDDHSIQIHSCHSPMREVEVLHDRLLEMFENAPDLEPKDILVMTPNIEVYAPYIQAVFDQPVNQVGRIPFSIADQSVKVEGRIIETFLAITKLIDSRYSSLQVVKILESRAVQRKFGLSEDDVALIRRWINDTRIRWGIDAANRGEMGLPDLPENTWKAGLDRLLLGYAMVGRDENMFAGVLPFDCMEGSETLVLGNFITFTEALFSQLQNLGNSKTPGEWSVALKRLFESFFLSDEDTEQEALIIRRLLNDLAEEGVLSGFNKQVDIHVIRCLLEQRFEKEGFGFGFISGGITFCAMLPMRSIPFKVICLIGMNSDSYPRQSKPLDFDFMAKKPRKGDRSRRNDDRYLFLEALLSAREKLYISYVGQSIRDNTVIPPSVLVSELQDYIEQGFQIQDGNISDHMVIKHRLQAFSTDYFRGNCALFSYSLESFETAECLANPRKTSEPFISTGLPEPGEDWKSVGVDDLSNFLVNPAGFLLNKRLGIYLKEGQSVLEETEPFQLTGWDRYSVSRTLVEGRLCGRELKTPFYSVKAAGLLPHGTVGECLYGRLSQETGVFAEKTLAYIREGMLAPLDVDLSISGFRITGRIDAIYPKRTVRYRYAKIKPKDRLKIWVQHLVLNCVNSPEYPLSSMIVGLDKEWVAWEYGPVANAEEILGRLLNRYWEGLMRPVHFFSESSWEYARQVVEKGKSEADALQKAYGIWAGNDFTRGEKEDLYYNLCFKNDYPIDSKFQELALEVFGPLMAVQKKLW